MTVPAVTTLQPEQSGLRGGTITSSDGKLTLDIPAGALTEDTEITITKINAEDLPPEFEGADPECAYELEPDGLEFQLPATVSIKLNEKPVQEDGSIVGPFVLLLTSNNGELEVLDNIQIDIDGDEDTLVLKGETTHLSPYIPGTNTSPQISGFVKFDIDLPDDGIIVENPFNLSIEIGLTQGGVLTDPKWSDFSEFVTAPVIIDFTGTPGGGFFGSGEYFCQTPFTQLITINGRLRTILVIGSPSSALNGIQLELSWDWILSAKCMIPDPAPGGPTAPPEPPVVPTFGAPNIDGTWRFDCPVITEVFPLIIPNLGDPVIFDAELIVIPETLELMIIPEGGIFTLDGILVPQPNGDFLYNGSGSGFLGDTNPNAANIEIEAEDWIFSQDVPGSFNGDPQPGDVFSDGVLRFNFPTLPLDNQSSTADCVGVKTGE